MTEVNEQTMDKNDAKMDLAQLYREEVYTDRKVGVIRALIPVLGDGSQDPERQVIYQGEAQIMTQMGALPISFEIEADSIAAAVEGYGEAAKAGVERTMREIQELRRQAANKIVVPGQPGFTPPAGGSGLAMP